VGKTVSARKGEQAGAIAWTISFKGLILISLTDQGKKKKLLEKTAWEELRKALLGPAAQVRKTSPRKSPKKGESSI